MFQKISTLALAITMFATSPSWAKDSVEVTHDGKFVSFAADKLTMTGKDGKEHSHMLASEAKVTHDGLACKASDLKAGMKIRVTTKKDNKDVATNVEAIDKHTMFANTHDGKFVSLKNHILTMKDAQGKEHTHMVAADATMTCDSKECSSDHLKVGMKIRVTTKAGEKGVATHVEAIDKDAEFSQVI
jgi:hypothetical protein